MSIKNGGLKINTKLKAIIVIRKGARSVLQAKYFRKYIEAIFFNLDGFVGYTQTVKPSDKPNIFM